MSGTRPNFDDESLWEKISDVPVFDEHEAVDPSTGAIVKIDRKRLEKIAAEMNAKDAVQPCPLTRGHTVPHQYDDKGVLVRPAPETEQPITLGYARGFKVVDDPALGRAVVKADYFLDKKHAEDARTYPRTSVEYWLRTNNFHPIALIRRTPKRDLPQWTYSQAGPCLRYSMEACSMDPTAPPDASAPGMDMKEQIMQCLKEVLPAMLQQLAGAQPAAAPGAPPAEPVAMNRQTPSEQAARYERELQDERKARLAAEARIDAVERDGRVARYERDLANLAGEGYDVNPVKELQTKIAGKFVADFTQAEFDEHKALIVSRYAKAPVGGQFIHQEPAIGGQQPPGRMTEAELEKCLPYMRQGKSQEEALQMVRAKK